MHSIPHGYTHQDILLAGALVIVATTAIVALMQPLQRIAEKRDALREADVRNLMEAVVELRYADSETFAALVGRTSNGRVMIGAGGTCAGDFGSQCGGVHESCLNLHAFGIDRFLSGVPVDPLSNIYSVSQTGYYVEQTNGVLEIGACQPEGREEVKLYYEIR